ncbi:hypothetical protein PV325_009634 [Microctonus aethiopoides]|nr:hypothetical protein PV325_009634 [Microctonus aethiopoides]
MAMIRKFGQINVANQLYRGINLFLHKNSSIPNVILRVKSGISMKYPPTTFHQLIISRTKTSKAEIEYHDINEPTQTSDTTEIELPDETHSYYDRHYNQPFYVDKTLLIKELFKKSHVLINAPSGFGKTLNMDMVRRFVEIELDKHGEAIVLDVNEDKCSLKEVQTVSKNFKLFQGKNISKEKEIIFKHFGKYPTIYVNFNIVGKRNFEQILDRLRTAIHRAFREHTYLRNSSFWDNRGSDKITFMKYYGSEEFRLLTKEEISFGLVFLSEILHDYHGKPVYVFIDDFEVPVELEPYQKSMDYPDREKTIELFKVIIRDLMKENKFVDRSLLNACKQRDSLLSEWANNVKLCAFEQRHPFSEFYGFNEDEIKVMLEKAGLVDNLNEIKKILDSYYAKLRNGDGIKIYSPSAIIQHIIN